mmetsp:Transcript_112896/g.324478  ORF Transcript_112896/g.324478 Transcript_112896/m.324478 type:complete len:205 (-) Transcript_112896:158-772(-)
MHDPLLMEGLHRLQDLGHYLSQDPVLKARGLPDHREQLSVRAVLRGQIKEAVVLRDEEHLGDVVEVLRPLPNIKRGKELVGGALDSRAAVQHRSPRHHLQGERLRQVRGRHEGVGAGVPAAGRAAAGCRCRRRRAGSEDHLAELRAAQGLHFAPTAQDLLQAGKLLQRGAGRAIVEGAWVGLDPLSRGTSHHAGRRPRRPRAGS